MRLLDHENQDDINDLDQWTKDFAWEFNRIHQQGYDSNGAGGDSSPIMFFRFEPFKDPNIPSYDDVLFAALNIRVNEDIANDVNLIRASSEAGSAEGNGLNALQLARLRFKPPDGSKTTLGESFNAIISKLGVNTQKARKMVENDQTLAGHLQNLKDSVSGVSLDEEMANMIRFQHAYGAAARMMTAVDEALDTIINRLGIVGR